MDGTNIVRDRVTGGIGADEPYWAALAGGEFKLPRCAKCKTWTWPAHYRCPCGSWDFDWEAVEPVGTVFSWTRTWYPFDRVPERHAVLPYATVLAEIPAAGGARVFGMVKGSDEGLKIGLPVRGVVTPASPDSKGYATICWELVR